MLHEWQLLYHIVLFNKVQINTTLLQGRKQNCLREKCARQGFSCMKLEIWEHTDQDDGGGILNLKERASEKWGECRDTCLKEGEKMFNENAWA